MISAADAVFLRRLSQSLKVKKADVYRAGRRRTSAAIILRFGSDNGTSDSDNRRVEVSKLFSKWDRGIGADEVIKRLEQNVDTQDLDRESDLRLLFVKRAVFTSDRWSGQVALPGGGRDPDDADDKETLRREAYHELGIPLDSPDFVLLGRLEDFQPRSRALTDFDELNGAVQARFVYLHIGDLTPSVTLSRIEIEAVRWCSFRTLLDSKAIDPARVVHHMIHFVPMMSTDIGSMFRDMFPCTFIRFPSIAVEPALPTWRIWGLPMRTVSEVVELYPTSSQVHSVLTTSPQQTDQFSARVDSLAATRPPMDWPKFSSNNFIVQFLVVDAYHGYLRLRSPQFPRWSQRLAEPYYLIAFAAVGMIGYSFMVLLMTLVHSIIVVLLMAFNLMEHEGYEKRKREYYAEHQPRSWSSTNFYVTPGADRQQSKTSAVTPIDPLAASKLENHVLKSDAAFLQDLTLLNASDEALAVPPPNSDPTTSKSTIPVNFAQTSAAQQLTFTPQVLVTEDTEIRQNQSAFSENTAVIPTAAALDDVLAKYR